MATVEMMKVGDEVVKVRRLTEAERYMAVEDFCLDRLPKDTTDEEWNDFAIGCQVLYRDDIDSGESFYQVVDAQGHGNGAGTWTKV